MERHDESEAMHKALAGSQAGKLTFPEVVGMLVNAGVESYFADLLRGQETFTPQMARHTVSG